VVERWNLSLAKQDYHVFLSITHSFSLSVSEN
jgi:hypothetical protein